MSGDQIRLTGLRARGRHGVLPEERVLGQEFVVDLVLHLDLQAAAATDDLAATVSYAEVAETVHALVTGEPHDLIEALAGRIGARLLADHLPLELVEVTVHKPAAPIAVPFGDVSVTVVSRRDALVVVALGANLGDPAQTLAQAERRLRRVPGLRVTARSGLYETDPVGGPDQPPYLNAVVVGRTRRSPAALLAELHRIEERHGRTREVRWGARTLDLDLVAYQVAGQDVVSDDPSLTLPHPRAHERGFVLVPWAQADPDAVLRTPAGEVRAVAQLAEERAADGIRPGPDWPERHRGGPC
ncbi:2-amino-4-hydroxy-6-hydroxymethyldihydropteridine diphosphokinase [Arsenicicoccus sp. oral taxon 190]|uniref:2-amino-4-hydroxy-6- hydroxymethyldihydropteridine diphosphokinase n=1 Tax=Arsenicicoccus sp. oral taxon 190 TaxID=1658671 RepID=UPI00067A0C51|nr:2-amino-4-hydroxy-6-hydroxymethyldihydropteridine diphosphokinase [Arsenicicoccus sp. oral taxon 190]AKT51173.1 2-amino-4-hydroxy-6-hydroxymethyldihydropteridine pyrophosphokinase [Arsenicicoccus sp. oral taxon 190]